VATHAFTLPVLVPEPPIFGWLGRLEPVAGGLAVLDLSHTALHGPGLLALAQEMTRRGVRVIGLTGLDPAQLGEHAASLPPLLPGRAAPAESLVIEGSVRSGQRVAHPGGDVSVVGNVASGAEIVAGGSVHIYGVLRGRASAGSGQIFCQVLEAEVLQISGIALVADDMEAALLGRAVRASLENGRVRLQALG